MFKNKRNIQVASIFIGLLLLLALYVQNFNLKSQIGMVDHIHLQIMHYELGVSIHTLEQEKLTSYMINNSIERLNTASYIANIGNEYRSTVINGYYDLNRIQNDREFREEVIVRLKAYHKALGEVLDNAKKYKENHFVAKVDHALSYPSNRLRNSINGKLYYNYITREPQMGYILNEKFNKELDRLNNDVEP